jgi:hypothetical protein
MTFIPENLEQSGGEAGKDITDAKDNLLLYFPEHSRNWELNQETGLVIIKKPKFQNKFLEKYILPRMARPDFKIKLDDFGSFVWKNMDGQTSVQEIGDRLRKEFGEPIEPVYERLGLFVRMLHQHKFIHYRNRVDSADTL